MKIDDLNINVYVENDVEGLEASMTSGEYSERVRVLYKENFGFINSRNALDRFPWVKQMIMGKTFSTINEFDQLLFTLDATTHKTNLGKNLIICLSLVFAKLMAKTGKVEFKEFIGRLVKNSDYQYPKLLLQVGSEAELLGGEVFWKIFLTGGKDYKYQIKNWQQLTDNLETEIKEGRIRNNFSDNLEELLGLIEQIKKQKQLDFGYYIASKGMQVNNGRYSLGGTEVSEDELLKIYQELLAKYEIVGIEDPFLVQDEQTFLRLTELNKDITVGNRIFDGMSLQGIKSMLEKEIINSAVISLVSIGSLTEIIQLVLLMKKYNTKIYLSENDFKVLDADLLDISQGLGVKGIKVVLDKKVKEILTN